MSTKTTFKRIALVAVASMGFGVLTSVAPASATSTGFSLSRSSITVVGANTGAAVFRIQLSAASSVAATAGHKLQSDETLTVSVVGVPTGVTATKSIANAAADLVLTEGSVATAGQPYSTFSSSGAGATDTTATDGVFGPNQNTYANSSASGAVARSYYLRVTQNNGAAQDQGTYTLRFRLVKGSLLVSETTAKVTFVSSAVDSGAKLALTRTGSTFVGTTGNISAYSETNNIKATLTDANDGQVINADGTAPALVLDSVTSTGTTAQTNGTLALVDDGTAADFGYADATATANPVNLAVNGTYGGTWTSPVIASETDRLRVRYGAASAFATSLVYAASTATAGTASVTGAGIIAGATAGTWSAPTSMTSATYTVALTKASGATAVQDEPVTITVTWAGSANAGDVKPVTGTDGAQIIKTDSTGRASITLTNSAPLNGQTATITATGTGAAVTEQVITWRSARSASALTTPNDNFTAALKSTNTVTFTFLDSFGAPVVGDLIALTIAGANSALGTVTIPSVKTDAKGQVSYTWTDAAADCNSYINNWCN